MDNLTVKQIKQTEKYKNLVHIGKSKLKKKDLLNVISKMSFNEKFLIIEKLSKLQEIHKLLGDRFRADAYLNGIRIIRNYEGTLPRNKKDLKEIDGIGKGLSEKIEEIMTTGKLKKLEELENNPSIKSILQLTRIVGIGPKLSKKLIQSKITSIQQLKQKVKEGEIKLTNSQSLGLKYFDDLNTRIPRNEIEKFEKKLHKIVKKTDPDLTAQIMGSYIRGQSNSGDIDILLSHKNIQDKASMNKDYIKEIVDSLKKNYENVGTLSKGKFKYMGLFKLDKIIRHIDIIFIPMESLPTAISYFVGSREHNMKFRETAKRQGYKLNEYGLYDTI